jgi:tripartite motif-containing protein 71
MAIEELVHPWSAMRSRRYSARIVRRWVPLLAALAMAMLVLTPSVGSAVTQVGSWGSPGSGNGQFNRPLGIAVDSSGTKVYVTDKENNRIEEFSGTGQFIRTFGPQPQNAILHPYAIAVAPNGNVYVTSIWQSAVFYYTANGVYLGRFGNAGHQLGAFDLPTGIAVAPNGDVYVADGRLQKFSSTGANPSVLKLDKCATAVAVAPDSRFFTTCHSTAQEYGATGVLVRSWGSLGTGPGQFKLATAIAFGRSYGDIFVVDSGQYTGRVQQFQPNLQLIQGWGDAALNHPTGIAVTGNNVIYVVNTYRDRIERYTS